MAQRQDWRPWALAGAAALAAGAGYTAWTSARARVEQPPQGRFLAVDGVRLHYLEAGPPEAPAIVLLHGNVVDARDWLQSGVLQRLAETHHVIAFDRPGCGYSRRPRDRLWAPRAQARAIAAGMEALGLGPAVVAGHSVGVQTALNLALDHPERVRALALLSGYYFPTLRLDSLAVGLQAAPVVGDLLTHTLLRPIGRLASPLVAAQMFAPQKPPSGFLKRPFELSLRPAQIHAYSADGFLMLLEARRLAQRYRELRLPIVAAAASEDLIVDPREQSQRFAAAVEARFIDLGPAGHMAHHAAPERVAEAILDLAEASTSGMAQDQAPGELRPQAL